MILALIDRGTTESRAWTAEVVRDPDDSLTVSGSVGCVPALISSHRKVEGSPKLTLVNLMQCVVLLAYSCTEFYEHDL